MYHKERLSFENIGYSIECYLQNVRDNTQTNEALNCILDEVKALSADDLFKLINYSTKAFDDNEDISSTILCEIVRLGQLELLEAIVNGGGFHDLDLNNHVDSYSNLSPIHICAQALAGFHPSDNDYHVKVYKMERILSILESGGIDNTITNLLNNVKRKTLELNKPISSFKPQSLSTKSAENICSFIPDKFRITFISYIADLSNYQIGFAPNETPLLPIVKFSKQIEELEDDIITSTTLGLDYINYLVWKSSLVIQSNNTQISNPKFKSKILFQSDDYTLKYKVFLSVVKHGSYQKLGETLFWLFKELDDNFADFDNKDFQCLILVNAAQNYHDINAVILLLNTLFFAIPTRQNVLDTAVSFEKRVELIRILVEEAYKINNVSLADRVLQYYSTVPIIKELIKEEKFWENIINEQDKNVKILKELGVLIEKVSKLKIPNDGDSSLVNHYRKYLQDIYNKCKEEHLSKNILAELVTEGGKTMLHAAAKIGLSEIVLDLIEHGADINAKDDKGCTAFYYAAKFGKSFSFNDAEQTHHYKDIIIILVYGGYCSSAPQGEDHKKPMLHFQTQGTRNSTGSTLGIRLITPAKLPEEKKAINMVYCWDDKYINEFIQKRLLKQELANVIARFSEEEKVRWNVFKNKKLNWHWIVKQALNNVRSSNYKLKIPEDGDVILCSRVLCKSLVELKNIYDIANSLNDFIKKSNLEGSELERFINQLFFYQDIFFKKKQDINAFLDRCKWIEGIFTALPVAYMLIKITPTYLESAGPAIQIGAGAGYMLIAIASGTLAANYYLFGIFTTGLSVAASMYLEGGKGKPEIVCCFIIALATSVFLNKYKDIDSEMMSVI